MLGNKALQTALDSAEASLAASQTALAASNTARETAEASLIASNASLTEANAALEAANSSVELNARELATANAARQTAEDALATRNAEFETAVAIEVENRLASAAPDIPVAGAANAEEAITDFEASYTESRKKGGVSHAKFLQENKAQIADYFASQQ